MPVDNQLIDNLLKDYKTPEEILGDNGLLKQLTKAVLERAMQAELTGHPGYERHDPAGDNPGNSRNGKPKKTLKGDFGDLPIEVPRDRNSTFGPKIVPEGQTRSDGLADKILSLYARGMTAREVQAHLEEIYQVEVSPALISSVTDAVLEEVEAWQSRPLDALYPVLYLDALQVKVRDGAHVRNQAIYLAIGINPQGAKEVLGLWVAQTEGAESRLQVVTELKSRGVSDIFIACVGGLKGFPGAIETVSPEAQVQLCVVHLVRHSLNYVGWKQRQEVAADLQTVYRAATRGEAGRRLEEFAAEWGTQFPTISRSWRSNWERVTPPFAYPQEIGKAVYTTNAIESVNMSLRKIIKHRGSFPTDEAAVKLLYLALQSITKKWTMPIKDWRAAPNRFAIIFEDRMPVL
jgi:putative transposase